MPKKISKPVKKKIVKKPIAKKKPAVKKEEPKVAPVAAVTTPVDPYKQIEPNNSGAPKNFMIRCAKCCWARQSSGLNMDLTDIHEIKATCAGCGKRRKFQCPKCGYPAMMKRIKGNT